MDHPTDQADLTAVPLFPLPNFVLFPRAVHPLHIFEQRYKAMTADALRGNRLVAMALLGAGWEKNYHGRPAVDPVVCVGTVLSHEKLPDGCYNFLLQGTMRARIVSERQAVYPYRVAGLEPLVERPALEIDLDEDRRRILETFESGNLCATAVGRQFRQLLGTTIPTPQIADLIAFHFLESIPLKQSLLAECDVRRRVARIAESFDSLYSAPQYAAPAGFRGDPNLN